MTINIKEIMDKLKENKYPFFVSERHFQVAFALALKEKYKNLTIIPEYVFENKYHIDLVAIDNRTKHMVAFEFKYVLNGGRITLSNNQEYKFRDHSAANIRREQVLYDIYRIEDVLRKDKNFKEGYAIILTNMARIFEKGTNGKDKAFDICQNKKVISKGKHKFENSKFDHKPIILSNSYPIKWEDYGESEGSKKFKYLSIKISK